MSELGVYLGCEADSIPDSYGYPLFSQFAT